MKKLQNSIVIAVLCVLISGSALAQEWTKEQQEVWKVVEDTWNNWKTKNSDGIAATLHDKYQGWSDESPLPMGKQELLNWFNSMKDMMTFYYSYITPARITVTANAAVVDYYFEFSGEYKMGDKTIPEEMKGKTVEFYVKEGGKWRLLGDFMSENKEKDSDDGED
jgi:hypothetical protein